MSLLVNLQTAAKIFIDPTGWSKDIRDPVKFEKNYKVASAAKRVFQVLAVVSVVGLIISIAVSHVPAACLCGIAFVVSLVAIWRFSLSLRPDVVKGYESLLKLDQIDWGKGVPDLEKEFNLGSDFKQNLTNLNKIFIKLSPQPNTDLKKRVSEKCWNFAIQLAVKNEFLEACKLCRYGLDLESEGSKLIAIQFDDATIRVPHYLRVLMLRNFSIAEKVGDAAKDLSDMKVPGMSWKEYVLTLRTYVGNFEDDDTGEMYDSYDYHGIPSLSSPSNLSKLFAPRADKKVEEDFHEGIELLRTLGNTEEELSLREQLEKILRLPHHVELSKVIVQLKEARVSSASVGHTFNDADLVLLVGLPLRNLTLSLAPGTVAGLQHLAGLPLKTLVVENITNEGLEKLQQCRQLKSLEVRRSKNKEDLVKDEGIGYLVSLSLTHLDLSTCYGITEQAFGSFKLMVQRGLCRLQLPISLDRHFDQIRMDLKAINPKVHVTCNAVGWIGPL